MPEHKTVTTPDGMTYIIGIEEEGMTYIGRETEPVAYPYPFDVEHIEHYCEGIEDPNPLYWSDEFGKQTRWGGRIGPWGVTVMCGEHAVWRPGWMEKKAQHASFYSMTPLPGTRLLATNYEVICHAPFRPGDRVTSSTKLVGIEPKTFRVGKGHLVTVETYFRNHRGELCVTDRRSVFRYEEGTGEGYEAKNA